MQEARIWYVNVFVSNFEESLSFYRDTLGLEAVVNDPDFGYASFKTDGAGFAFARTDQAELVGRHTGVGWGVRDLDTTYKELAARGVAFEAAPAEQPWGGYMAIFRDPDGNQFYLDQLRDD